MKKVTLFSIILISLSVFGLISYSLSVEAQTVKTVSLCTFTSKKSLSVGVSNNDVLLVQKILNQDPDTKVAASGFGSPDKETKFFGRLTQVAIKKFQIKYKDEILTPLKLKKATGILGVSTRAKMISLCQQVEMGAASSSTATGDLDTNQTLTPTGTPNLFPLNTSTIPTSTITTSTINTSTTATSTTIDTTTIFTPPLVFGGNPYQSPVPAYIYVALPADGGDDANSGGSTSCTSQPTCGPVATISKALSIAKSGDTIGLYPGTYHQNAQIEKSVTLEQVPGTTEKTAIIDGSDSYAIISSSSYHYTLRIISSDVTVRNLVIENQANQDVDNCLIVSGTPHCKINIGIEVATPYLGSGTQNVVLDNNDFTNIKYPKFGAVKGAIPVYIYGYGDSDAKATKVTISNNNFYQNAPSGAWQGNAIVLTNNTKDSTVENNHIYNFIADGYDSGHFIGIETTGNTAVDTTDDGPGGLDPTLDHARNITVRSNLIEKDGGANISAFYVQGGQNITFENNTINGAYGGINIATEKPVTAAHYSSDVIVKNNTFKDTIQYDFQAGNPAGPDNLNYRPVNNITVTDNTFISTSSEFWYQYRIMLRPELLGASTFYRNTIISKSYLLYRNIDWGENDMLSDYNTWQNTNSEATPFYWDGVKYDWADYLTTSTQDVNSTYSN